jgi:hypothetical protein
MKLFAGLGRTDYQDLLRAVGAWIDEQGLVEVRLWEHAEGVIVQGRRGPDAAYQTVLLTDEDLRSLLAEAYRRRGHAAPAWLRRRT